MAAVVLIGAGCARETSTQSLQPTGAKVPALSFQDYAGKTVALQDLVGTPLVINSWAAWCPFCKKELKDFADVQDAFKGKIIFVSIDRAESLLTSKKFSDELGVTDRIIFLLDPEDSFYRAIGGFTMPETIFVNSGGEIVFHKRGPMTAAEVRNQVQQIISP